MTRRELAPEEDEHVEPVMPESIPPDVPEADAVEQAAPVRGRDRPEPDTVGDGPEADTIDQQIEVAETDDEDGR
jgi:hypothetical protein